MIYEKSSREAERITINNQSESGRPTTNSTLNQGPTGNFGGPYNDTVVLPSIVGLVGKKSSIDANSTGRGGSLERNDSLDRQ